MFFNRSLYLVLCFFISLCLSLLGCGLYIGEKGDAPNVEGFSVGCLNGIDQKIDSYLKGELDKKTITKVSNCLKMALTLFKDRVHGKKKGEFTPQELRKFIQDMFLQDHIIRDQFLNQLIQLKVVMIGGSKDKLTNQDIEKFIHFVDILKKEALFFQPFLKALHVFSQKNKAQDVSQLAHIDQNLKQSINRVSVFFEKFAKPYPLKDIKGLLRELDFFSDHHYNMSHLSEKVDLAGALKQFVFYSSGPAIHPKEWGDFLTSLSYLMSAYIHWTILKKEKLWFAPKGTKLLTTIVQNGYQFLSLSLTKRTNGQMTSSDFVFLGQYLKKAGFWPKDTLGDRAVESLFNILFGKVYQLEKPETGPTVITADKLQKMDKHLRGWLEAKSFIDHQYGAVPKETHSVFKLDRALFSSADYFAQANNMFKDIFSLKPLYKEGYKVFLSTDIYKQGTGLDYKNIKLYSFYYLLADVIRLGYEKDHNLYKKHIAQTESDKTESAKAKGDTVISDSVGATQKGMAQAELKQFFEDFRPIAEDMGWFEKGTDKGVMEAGEAEFIAANILTPSAKGFVSNWREQEFLSGTELIEYIAYAFSFGLSLKEVGPAIYRLCAHQNGLKSEPAFEPTGGGLNVVSSPKWENQKYDKDCVKLHLISVLREHTKNMPDFQKALQGMSKEQKQALAFALIYISYPTAQAYESSAYMAKVHLKNVIMALYFVETTINKYDKNKDLTLQNQEIWEAFPTFQGYLSNVLIYLMCQPTDKHVQEVYAYTIENEILPSHDKWHQRVIAQGELMIGDFYGEKYWDLYLNRAKLTNVFSTLTKGLLSKKTEVQGKPSCVPLARSGVNLDEGAMPSQGEPTFVTPTFEYTKLPPIDNQVP